MLLALLLFPFEPIPNPTVASSFRASASKCFATADAPPGDPGPVGKECHKGWSWGFPERKPPAGCLVSRGHTNSFPTEHQQVRVPQLGHGRFIANHKRRVGLGCFCAFPRTKLLLGGSMKIGGAPYWPPHPTFQCWQTSKFHDFFRPQREPIDRAGDRKLRIPGRGPA